MTLRRKLEGEAELRATAADVIHEIFKNKPHHVSHAASHFVQGVDLHEGENGKVGAKNLWNYTLGDGKPLVAKSVLEEIDEEKKYVKHRIIGGELLRDIINFTISIQVIPKDDKICIVKWTFEYEKMHSSSPEPTTLMDLCLEACCHLDDHHHGIKK